jgi:hypothetical protein
MRLKVGKEYSRTISIMSGQTPYWNVFSLGEFIGGYMEVAMESPSVGSNVPEKILQVMDFYTALKELAKGKKIAREEWEDKTEHCFMRNEQLHIHRGGQDHTWIVQEADMVADDWILI